MPVLFYHMILFLYGPDTYRSSQKLREIVGEYEKTYPAGFHAKTIDCRDATFSDFRNEVETISMFERKKLVILKNVFGNGEFEAELVAYKDKLVKSNEHIVVIFEEEEIKTKSKNTLYKFLKKNARWQEFALLTASNLQRWIQQEFAKYDVKIGPRAREILARSVGSDLWQLSNEVQKVALFKKSETEPVVKEADLALFVTPKIEADIFATIDAIAQKDKKQALLLMYKHLAKGDSPYYLFTMLVYQFRIILEIKDMLERQIPYNVMLQKSKMHPYVLKKGCGVADRFSLTELKEIYKRLFRLDVSMKTGKVESRAVFDVFIAGL